MGNSRDKPASAQASIEIPADALRYIRISGLYCDMVGIISKHVQKAQGISFHKDPDAVVAAVERALPPVLQDFGVHLIYYYDGRFYSKMRDNFHVIHHCIYTERKNVLMYNDKTYYCVTTPEEMRALPRYGRWDVISKCGYPMIIVPRDV